MWRGGGVFAIDEANSKVESFAVTDAATGALAKMGADVGSGGSGPAHVAVTADGKWVLAANYGSGDVGVVAVGADGTLGAVTSVHAGVKAHMTLFDVGGAVAWVPCLGSSYVAQYAFDGAAGTLTPLATATMGVTAGSGPRHLALHPTRKIAYLIEETASMVGAYAVGADGGLTELQAPIYDARGGRERDEHGGGGAGAPVGEVGVRVESRGRRRRRVRGGGGGWEAHCGGAREDGWADAEALLGGCEREVAVGGESGVGGCEGVWRWMAGRAGWWR